MALTLGFAPTSAPSTSRVRQARVGVLLTFALMGMVLSTFLSRVPTIRDLLDVDASGLANLIIFGAVGALAGLLVTGWAAAKWGTRALLLWSSMVGMLGMLGEAFGPAEGSKVLFAAGFFLVSFSFAFTNVAMNTEAAEVERHMGKPVMSQFHAGFSVGMALGLALGAIMSHLGVPVQWHFTVVMLAITAVRISVAGMAAINGVPDPDAPPAALGGPFATAKAEYKNKRIVLIGVIVFAASMAEMTAAQWMALAVVDDFGKPESMGDLMYWTFVISMVTVRWLGAPIIGRLGRVVSLRTAAVSITIGVLLFAFTPVFWLVPVAALFWGVGCALGVPIAFSAAADEPKRAAAAVAAVASFSTVSGLLVPQAIGHLAGWVPLREAMLLVILAAATTFVLARAVRRDGKLFRSRRAMERSVGSAVLHSDEAATGVGVTGDWEPREPSVGRPRGDSTTRS
ncbi:MFS transporter [Demequina aurantiaca]|uniref:MFS transporter n=1 Tax=Demequina aurantiaca TaxID=676200 RepID=UPI003D34AAB6